MKKRIVLIYGVVLALCLCGCASSKRVENNISTQEMFADMDGTDESEAIHNENDKVDSNQMDNENKEQEQCLEKEYSAVEEAKENASVTLIMVGDMLMHTPVNESGVMEDGSIDFSHLFTYTKDRY